MQRNFSMKVFLRQDVEQLGMAGEIVTVSDGFARNYLLPRKKAIRVSADNEESLRANARSLADRERIASSGTEMKAERIRSLAIELTRKTHDSDKLYGSINQQEIVDALKERGIIIAKNQVLFEKAIKTTGEYQVKIKLSSAVQPHLTVHVGAE